MLPFICRESKEKFEGEIWYWGGRYMGMAVGNHAILPSPATLETSPSIADTILLGSL